MVLQRWRVLVSPVDRRLLVVLGLNFNRYDLVSNNRDSILDVLLYVWLVNSGCDDHLSLGDLTCRDPHCVKPLLRT